MKLTPWFPPEVMPVRPGVYEVKPRWFAGPLYRLWDGRAWRTGGETPALAAARTFTREAGDNRQWRGIQKD